MLTHFHAAWRLPVLQLLRNTYPSPGMQILFSGMPSPLPSATTYYTPHLPIYLKEEEDGTRPGRVQVTTGTLPCPPPPPILATRGAGGVD